MPEPGGGDFVNYAMNATLERLLTRYQAYELSSVIDYDKFNHYAITHHSTRIEGATLTETETRILLEDGLTPKGKPLEHSLMVQDHYQALLFVLQEAKAKASLSTKFIQQLNACVMRHTGNIYHTALGTVDASRGEFRQGNVSAGGSYFVNYDKVEKLTTTLAQELSEGLKDDITIAEQLELSFAAHFNLVSIHPFYDGNGRTSRLLMNFIQAWYQLPIAVVFSEDRTDYFEALLEARKEKAIDVFYQFMYGQYEKYLALEVEKYETMLNSRPFGGKSFSLLF